MLFRQSKDDMHLYFIYIYIYIVRISIIDDNFCGKHYNLKLSLAENV